MSEQTTSRIQWLLSQMAAGWCLEAPVIERTGYNSVPGQGNALEFILHNERGCQAVSIRDCPELRSFLKERGLECIAV